MNLKKIILSGLAAGLIAFLVGNVLYMNPLVSGIYAGAGAYYCAKPMDSFGWLGNWFLLMMAGGLVSAVFLAFLYSYTEKGIRITPVWKKGAAFGILMWLVSALPASYNTWLLHTYPDILVIVETINGLIGGIVAGVVLAILYEKIN